MPFYEWMIYLTKSLQFVSLKCIEMLNLLVFIMHNNLFRLSIMILVIKLLSWIRVYSYIAWYIANRDDIYNISYSTSIAKCRHYTVSCMKKNIIQCQKSCTIYRLSYIVTNMHLTILVDFQWLLSLEDHYSVSYTVIESRHLYRYH